jgi:hypothetical protein
MNPQPQVPYRRRIKLIKPWLQLKLLGVFVGLSALGFLLQSLHVGLRLSELASTLPEGGSYLMAVMPELPLEILLVSFGMLLPLTIAVGILVTFRIAGPVYRFEKYLKAVMRGEETGPCRIRKGDEFQELCELLNQVTAEQRERIANQQADKTTNTDTTRELRKAG